MPALVFIHGLLGTSDDWQAVIQILTENNPHLSCISLDLPFHGKEKKTQVTDFEETCAYISKKIQLELNDQPYFLIGYSLGGRIALYYALHAHCHKGHLQGLLLEGANLGLTSSQEREVRWQNDCAWADAFRQQSPQKVLNSWYQQPVFRHLTESQRQALINKRLPNCGENIANMLCATSLAKQPDFRETLKQANLPIYYFCGSQDDKFQQLATESQLPLILIPHAGHNAHLENPIQFAEEIQKIIHQPCFS